MSIAHLSQSVSTQGGGISEVLRALASAQHAAGHEPHVVSVSDDGEALSPWPPDQPHLLKPRRLPGMLYLPGLEALLDQLSPDVTHVHGLWTYLSIGVPKWAAGKNAATVVSPHGMLDAWALANSRWKKRLAAVLYERRHLGQADCVHALCKAEARSIREFGVKSPIAVIPNGIDLPSLNPELDFKGRSQGRFLLFLGRLHPKKGLLNALRAWSLREDRGDWKFLVTGWDQGGHEAELKQLCDELGLSWATPTVGDLIDAPDSVSASVLFTGPAFGEEKAALLKMASAFILPSFSEGLPMSVLEAWAYHLPVLMTEFCNLEEGFEADAAIRIGTEVPSIADGLAALFGRSETDLQVLAKNGRRLVEEKFTWSRIAADFQQLYEWIGKRAERPSFVE
ncbi:glycosyltransferase [Haloferula chungangensis]|uniref:Glycosyltransferase n=1 Tax=Haloferula chungangensis TaxID=1048331 RepID=A0ABW2L6Y4_9BACT